MKVLALPPERHGAVDPLSDSPPGHAWYLAHSRPGRCATLAKELRAIEIPYYRAMGRFGVIWADGRKRYRVRPLFPNYLFLCTDDAGRSACRRSRACAVVEWIRDQDAFRSELAALDRMFALEAELQLGPAIQVGQAVRVDSLNGQVGQVRRLGSRDRVYVTLTTLGQSVSVEVDRAQVEPLSRKAVPSSR